MGTQNTVTGMDLEEHGKSGPAEDSGVDRGHAGVERDDVRGGDPVGRGCGANRTTPTERRTTPTGCCRIDCGGGSDQTRPPASSQVTPTSSIARCQMNTLM